MPLPYQGVQGGHALAQWLIEHPNQTWNNNYLIYLGVSKHELEKWIYKLNILRMDFSKFEEPDLDNQITAIACQLDKNREKLFDQLQLMGAQTSH